MPVNFNRRTALSTISVAVVVAGTAGGSHNAAANTASARLGTRLAKERGSSFALDLAREASGPLNARTIAEEYRQGRTLTISGVLYSRSEAAVFSRAAVRAGMVSV